MPGRAQFEDVVWTEGESFLVRSFDLPSFNVPWHLHPEWELTLIQEGGGDRSVGDHLEGFQEGDLVLVGPHLPHYWRSSPALPGEPDSTSSRARAVVVHLREDSLGSGFFDLPEARLWRRLLHQAARGLSFPGTVVADVRARIESLPLSQGPVRLLTLLDILLTLAEALPQARILAAPGFIVKPGHLAVDRMGRVHEYLYTHLEDPLTLDQVAQVAGMSPAAFSRYCKLTTGRTLTRLVQELRIAVACRHLIDTSMSVSEIAFASGFQSLSNFNRVFLELKSMAPTTYRQRSPLGKNIITH